MARVADERIRWVPDEQLIPSVLAGSGRRMSELECSDRSWVVAGLTLAGLTAEDIADRLGCSLRLVRSIRAEDMTRVCSSMQQESAAFTGEMRMLRAEVVSKSRQVAALSAELERTRGKLDRLIDAHITGARPCGKCGTPMQGYNLYEHGGKQFCRECHRRRQQQYRDSRGLVSVLPGVVALSM